MSDSRNEYFMKYFQLLNEVRIDSFSVSRGDRRFWLFLPRFGNFEADRFELEFQFSAFGILRFRCIGANTGERFCWLSNVYMCVDYAWLV